MTKTKNIFNDIPKELPEELFETLINGKNVKVERIISKGHKSAENSWYDQDMHEWVLVLQGKARLEFADETQSIILNKGDYINIRAHTKHRVEWTNPDVVTIWLAIHYD